MGLFFCGLVGKNNVVLINSSVCSFGIHKYSKIGRPFYVILMMLLNNIILFHSKLNVFAFIVLLLI
ncbi:MAG TPA: hypothetical protein DHU75_00420 [Rikenellaceae bacterium]|nr:hypothetical protein [Rikenellaceae bacterium]